MKLINKLITLLFVIIITAGATSCGGKKVFTQRSSGINGRTGAHTVFKTQKHYNFEAAMRRSDPYNFYVFGIKVPKPFKK